MLKLLFNRHSLVTRLIWLNILAVIAVSVLIGFWTRSTLIQDSRTLGIERQQILNQRINTSIDEELTLRKKRLGQLSSELTQVDTLKPLPEIQKIIDKKYGLHDAFKGGLVVIGLNGEILVDSPIVDNRVGIYLGDREHFLSSKEHKKSYISKPIFGRGVKEPIYIISSPILRADGEFLGTVTGVTKLKNDTVLQKVADGYLGKSSHVYILDLKNQLIVTSSKKEFAMQPLSQLKDSGVLTNLNNGVFSGESHSHFGGNVIYSASVIEQTGWIVVNTYISSDWTKHADNLIREIIWLSIISMLIIIAFSVYYLRRQLLPLNDTTQKLKEMSQPGVKAEPITSHYDDELGVLINAFNHLIYELKNNEAKLIIATEQAESASHAKTQFLSNISHEIKTPLNAILTLTHIQLEQTFDYESHFRLKKIQSSGRSLLALMNDIFSFIELDNKNVSSISTHFNLEDTLVDLVQEYAELTSDKSVEVFFDIERGIPTNLSGDSHHLLQVIGHLLSNAVKFTEQGHILVEVTQFAGVEPKNSNQILLQISVTDTGQGISEEKLNQLFEVFKQLDESNTRTYGGIGMGLAISSKLLQIMGASEINVESQLGKGSKFYFTVPLMIDDKAVYPIINKPVSRSLVFAENTKSNSTNARVLIVDDNYVNRELVAILLKKHQLKYDIAKNGLEAVEYAKQHSYDLILMDLQMPKMDGYQATKEIRNFNKEIPIIALTATALNEDRSKAFEAGMSAFLTKPIEPKLFYQELGRYIDFIDDVQTSTLAPKNSSKLEIQAKQRILIVDDEVANLKLLANSLNNDYTVQVANNGKRAIELCNRDTPPDLVLLDIKMPNMDGYEVIRLLKDNPNTSAIPVIFVTALSTPESEEKGLSLGAVDYITKPYQMPVVQARIRTHINLKQKTDLLEQLSYVDGLTKIANRRYFDITLDNELTRLQRSNQFLALIMIDIDFFKPYNDNYGHGKGDECLQQVAKALSDEITRPSDLLARYGGEEFVVILPETDVKGVTAVAEKLRHAINDLKLTHEHSAVADHITISLGCLAEKVTRSTHVNPLLKRVDDALYEAKKRGRNQLVVAKDPPTLHPNDL